jgi:Na+-translocating ferredoxin:NAD+ oxidoreductase RnfD subunit
VTDPRGLGANMRRFFRTPKGLTVIALALIAAIAVLGDGTHAVWVTLASGIIPAMGMDGLILRARKRRWVFPDGALLTGAIVAMILSPHEPAYVTAITSAVAVASKYVIRSGTANIFNPAAFALVATFHIFDTAQSWWGALPERSMWWLVALIATGLFISERVNKLPAVVAFLGVYYALCTAAAFAGNPAHVAELYRTPDVHAALFFAFFMVSDPPTSPPKARDQVIFATIAAVVSVVAFEWIGAAYFLLAGVLAANAWEAWRRRQERRSRRASMAGRVGVS